MTTALTLEKLYDASGLVALDGTGDVWTFTAVQPVTITRVGFVETTAETDSENTVVKVDSVLKGASRGDGDIAVIDADPDTSGVAVAINSGVYVELTTPFDLDVGEQAVFQVTTASTAGDGVVFIEYMPQPFVGSRISEMRDVSAGNV